jgi:hypothetical protein
MTTCNTCTCLQVCGGLLADLQPGGEANHPARAYYCTDTGMHTGWYRCTALMAAPACPCCAEL